MSEIYEILRELWYAQYNLNHGNKLVKTKNLCSELLENPTSTVCLGSTDKLSLCWKLKQVNLLEMT